MQIAAKDILYTAWEQIPIKKLHIILQILPVVDWEEHGDIMNTYAKNIILKYLFRDIKLYKKTTPQQRVDLYTYEMDWLRHPTHCFLIPTIKMHGVMFHAPADGLTDISIERLAEADTRLSRYLISQKSYYMDSFIACLYKHEHELFNQKALEANTGLLSRMEDYKKVSIVQSYLGSRMMIMRLCDALFPEPSGKKEKKNIFRPQDLGPMWDDLIFDLANTKGYAGVATAKNADAIEALQYLNREIVNAKKQLKHAKSTF